MIEPGTRRDHLAALWRTLAAVFSVLLLLVVAHDVDHIANEERLGELSVAFWVFLPFQYGAFLAVLASLWQRHPLAPTLVAALAATALVAFIGAHLVPLGPLPYADGDPLVISWALVFAPMAVALAAFVVAMRLRSAERTARPERVSRA